MKILACGIGLLAISGACYADTTFVVTTDFHAIAGAPQLMIVIQGLTQKTMTPYLLTLQHTQEGFQLPIPDNFYRIVDVEIQYPDHTLRPCVYTADPVLQKDARLALNGVMNSEGKALQCAITYTPMIVQHTSLSAESTAGSTVTSSTDSATNEPTSFVHFSDPGTARYLTNLKTCSPGVFYATDATTHQSITYRISGLQNNTCQVSISSPSTHSTLQCQFDAAATKAIATPQRIQMYSTGNTTAIPNDSMTQYYSKQCSVTP